MKKFAAYQTNKRKFDGGEFGAPDAKGGRFDRPKREKQKPREGREPELNIFIDKRFNYWNLPVKAKVILVSNLPQVRNMILKYYFQIEIFSGCVSARSPLQHFLILRRC